MSEKLMAAKQAGAEVIVRTKSGIKNLCTKLLCLIALVTVFTLAFMWVRDQVKDLFTKPTVLESVSEKVTPHETVVTNIMVKNELKSIGEVMTYEYTYAGNSKIEDTRELFNTGLNIPFTTHEIGLTYSGVIKVGYKVSDIKVDVNNNSKKIKVTLPENVIVDNNLPEENVQCIEDNNLFNPIESTEVCNRLAEIKTEELKVAEDAGLYELAEDNAKEIIKNLLEQFEGYSIDFA